MQYSQHMWVRRGWLVCLGLLAGVGQRAWAQGEKVKPQGADQAAAFPIT